MHSALYVCATVLTLSVVAAGQAPKATSTGGASSDKAAIRMLEQRFRDAVRAADVEKIMASYERGKKLVFFDVVPQQAYVGWNAYKKDWQAFFSTFSGPISFEIKGLEITVVGNLAYSYSFQHVAGKGIDGNRRDYTVRVTDVYRKLGGKWLIVHEHVSVPVDLKTGKAVLQPKPLSQKP